jgi:hypothetical protein
MIVLIHVANVLYLFSYLVKDILKLRVLTVVAGLILLGYYVAEAMPVWAAIAWNILFLGINLWQVKVLLVERRPVRLEPYEQRMYRLAFRSLTPHEFAKLARIARWETVGSGARLVRRGEDLEKLMVLESGAACVEVDGRPVAPLKPGQFIGEMSFLTGEHPNADVVTLAESRVVSWERRELRAMLGGNAELRAAVQMVIGADLALKLKPAGGGAVGAAGDSTHDPGS